MPKVKSEKRSAAQAEEPTKAPSRWGAGGKLFGTETTETTFQGAGFKDRDKALETIQLLKGRDISFQFQIINSMFHRAKVILKRTKDAEKVKNLTEAVETFEAWLDDYRAHNRSKENFSYLPLETVQDYERLAESYSIKLDSPSFLQVYKDVDGDLKKLRMLKVDKDDEKSLTWDVVRNNALKEVNSRIKTEHLPMFETDAQYRGLPSKDHVELIMWGFSPDVTKIKKAVPFIESAVDNN